jgi:hypothetical protein
MVEIDCGKWLVVLWLVVGYPKLPEESYGENKGVFGTKRGVSLR